MRKLIVVIVIVLIVYGTYNYSYYLPSREKVFVDRVIDGDTIDTPIGKIRLLGINAPDVKEPYYEEATDELRRLVEGKYIEIEKDSRNKDVYRRFLRYIYIDGEAINLLMVREGLAVNFGNTTKYKKELLAAENDAKANKLGVWSFY